ncbi:hopanoid C-3 methylase HpnR [Parafrankia sp. FMc2]|uniref:hopanoid C-3 methylase HpnR n=1 Tax=Parafrankia sp. FMc2 TaxID=3233196 RepID=UPI0034D74FFB
MRVLLVHPSALMYSEIFLRLEPIGLERVGAALLRHGHDVRIIDLQTEQTKSYLGALRRFQPECVMFGLNYLANVPEVITLAKQAKAVLPGCLVVAGGHSVSFIARHLLDTCQEAIDAVARGEGETVAPRILATDRDSLHEVPGVVTRAGTGPPPAMLPTLDEPLPARHLLPHRSRYFIGELDPCASVEFTRGCPWDCSFCSAWTFYGRSYRRMSPDVAGHELATIREPNVFLVDDVAFIKPDHGMAIADQIERRRIRKRYYLETRADVLLRHPEVFRRWHRLGLTYMFLGMEALDAEGLDLFHKRISPDENIKALEIARKIGITVAVNLIADPGWDAEQFRLVREWALSVPEIVHLTVITPYPGTEIWHTQAQQLTSLDYRLFDIQHAVTPTRLPLDEFYRELVATQAVLNRKHLGVRALAGTARIVAGHLAHGQTNFVRMLWKFPRVYNAERLHAEHSRPVTFRLPEPSRGPGRPHRRELYVHQHQNVPQHDDTHSHSA